MSTYDALPRPPGRLRPALLDWSLAAPILVGLVLQLATAVWWGASVNARVAALEAERSQLGGVPEQLARLDERSQAQSAALLRLTSQMDGRPLLDTELPKPLAPTP
jgi:hypothetical protein